MACSVHSFGYPVGACVGPLHGQAWAQDDALMPISYLIDCIDDAQMTAQHARVIDHQIMVGFD